MITIITLKFKIRITIFTYHPSSINYTRNTIRNYQSTMNAYLIINIVSLINVQLVHLFATKTVVL